MSYREDDSPVNNEEMAPPPEVPKTITNVDFFFKGVYVCLKVVLFAASRFVAGPFVEPVRWLIRIGGNKNVKSFYYPLNLKWDSDFWAASLPLFVLNCMIYNLILGIF